MAGADPWRNRKIVRISAAIDMASVKTLPAMSFEITFFLLLSCNVIRVIQLNRFILLPRFATICVYRMVCVSYMLFPLIIMGIYMYRLMYERAPDGRATNGFFTPREKQGVAVFMWCAAFIINIIQLFLTYYLFTSVKLGVRDAEMSIRTSKLWLIFSNGLFVLLLSEFIFFLFFDKGYYGSRKTVSTLVCAAELFFKPVGMYFTKDFIDDLKSVYSIPPAKVQFLTFINNVRKSNPQPPDSGTV